MSTQSSIEWTETTWNPTTGCDRISAGCDNCYALTLAKRLKAMGQAKYQNDGDPRTSGPGFGIAIHESALMQPLAWRTPRMNFVKRAFDVMRQTPQHTYQILTKRAARVRHLSAQLDWPDNVWMGVSVESAEFVHRIDDLRKTGARTKFISAEPLLSDLGSINLTHVDWLIAGGESGPKARPVEPNWIRSLRDQCQDASTAFFFKQWGGRTPKAGGRVIDGRTWDEFPVKGSTTRS